MAHQVPVLEAEGHVHVQVAEKARLSFGKYKYAARIEAEGNSAITLRKEYQNTLAYMGLKCTPQIVHGTLKPPLRDAVYANLAISSTRRYA